MKKLICIIIAAVFVLSFAGCKNEEKPDDSSVPADSESALPVDSVSADTADTSGPETTEPPEDTSGPDSLSDFAGIYVNGDSSAQVLSDSADRARIIIEWSDTHISYKKWEIEGVFDPETLSVVYGECTVYEVTCNADGTEDSEVILSGSNSGSVVFSDAGRSFTWNDELMDEKNVIFTWSEK